MGSQGYGCSSSAGGFSSSKNEREKRKTKTAGILRVLPCSVSQLLSAREHRDSFFIRDVELNQVTVVGLIRRSKPKLTHLVYSLDDMTGPHLEVIQWVNLEWHKDPALFGLLAPTCPKQGEGHSGIFWDCAVVQWTHCQEAAYVQSNLHSEAVGHLGKDVNMNHCVISPGSYVKVVGSLRSFQHHRSMVAFNIRCLDDFNEITSHMLEVIQAHLHSDSSSYSRMNNETSTIINTSHASDPATIGFTANQRQVFTLIKSCPLAEGISMECLRKSLKYLSLYDIRTCLQFLINEGHIFSTIDDFHFKSTNL
ncbi:replication protein A 32 kDa subunit isoform X1 [Ictalurus punctatus]|uniref:Replication protein A 32 kDa subunit isoform X1 n=1 Tax=Ictalurus punctatus TaxID=7998 RepID=A0A2D0S0P4_ICTPU|nr:replication protein A 32 kDa subunit isoform X1 [Ictalurus punctatus]